MSSAHTTHSTTPPKLSHGESFSRASRTLWIAIFLGVGTLVLEIVGGLKSGSLALLSDAGHEFSDLLSLIIALFAIRIATRPPTSKRTFGYHRAEVFSALVNGLLLVFMAAGIGVEAWQRLSTPHHIVNGGLASLIGFIGLLPNIWTVARLHSSTNINIKSAFFHALGDAASSVVVVTSGILIALTGLVQFDAIASFVVVVFLLFSATRLLKHVFAILLEGVPENIDREEISKMVCALPGVCSTHDVHLWALCSDVVYFTGHLVVDGKPDIKKTQDIISRATSALDKAGVHHATLQVETIDHSCTKEESCEIIH